MRVPIFSGALAVGKEFERTGQVDEPANGNLQAPLKTEGEEPAPANTNAAPRASLVTAIPTVPPSQRLPQAPEADGPSAEGAAAEDRATGHTEITTEPMVLAPDVESPASGPAAEAPADPVALRIESSAADDGEPAELFVDQSCAPEAEPGAIAPMLFSPVIQDAHAAPVAEEQVWSGPQEAALQPTLPTDGSPQLQTLRQPDTETQPRASHVAQAQTHRPAPLETVATVPDRAVWSATMAPAPPAAATPSSGDRTLRDLLPYLGLAGRIAGAAVLALSGILLLLVVVYRWVDPPTSTLMLGQRLVGTRIEQTWVPLERISPNLVHAVILSEDTGFCRHRGVDWPALGEAIETDRGGSTITMQVVKNLFLWPARSYVRKALEIALAYLVEAVWPKQRVLEIYLNIAEWGPGIFGAEAAARHHFGKPAARLTAQEAALLAVALPNPLEREAGYPGYLHRRLADNLLTRMRAVRTAMRCVRPLRSGS